jgi:DnaK suppressor protein
VSQHNALRVQLQSRLDQLLKRVGAIEGDLRATHDRDWQERASELENDEVLEGLDELGRGEVRRLRQALTRIDSGSYGLCSSCGQPIGAARLAALPGTVSCVDCAASDRTR